MNWIVLYFAFNECGSDMKRKVNWNNKESEESGMELSEETSESEVSDEE